MLLLPTHNPTTHDPQPETTGRKFTLKHNLSLRRNTYKYLDASNLTYYGDFKTDDRGIRNYIATTDIENTFSIRTFRLADGGKNNFLGARRKEVLDQKDLLEVGLTHTYTKINQEPYDSNLNNIFLFGKMDITPSERLFIKSYWHLGIGKQAGDYYLKGDFLWGTQKLGKINFSLTNQMYSPSLIQQRFLVTQQEIWNNNFNKVLENSFSVSYALPKLKIDFNSQLSPY